MNEIEGDDKMNPGRETTPSSCHLFDYAQNKTFLSSSYHSICAVIFDIDGTLVDIHRILNSALSETGQEIGRLFGRAFTAAELQQIRNEVSGEPQFASARLEEKRRESFRRALQLVNDVDGAHLDPICDFFFERRFATCYIYPDVMPTLEALRGMGLTVVAASNGNSYLAGTPLAGLLDATFHADDLGVKKPNSHFYAAVAEKIGLLPSQVLHVGDSFENDYEGPRPLGMESILLCRTTKNCPGLLRTVDTLTEIPELISQLYTQ
ncbi:MAG: HAD family hydrolase [Chloroflexota bacterium]